LKPGERLGSELQELPQAFQLVLVGGLDEEGILAKPAPGDRPLTGKILESGTTAVAAHAAPPQSADGKEVVGPGLHDVVEADRPGGQGRCYLVASFVVMGKEVEGKRTSGRVSKSPSAI